MRNSLRTFQTQKKIDKADVIIIYSTSSFVFCPVFYYYYMGRRRFVQTKAGGVQVLRANIVTDYGVVHILDGLMDRHRLMDWCPSLRQPEGQQVQNGQHSISLRKVSDQDFFAGQQSIKTNEIDTVVPDPSPTESKYFLIFYI